jgi:hypothetical protein
MAEMVPTPPLSRNTRAAYLLADRIAQRCRYRAFALVNTAMLTSRRPTGSCRAPPRTGELPTGTSI